MPEGEKFNSISHLVGAILALLGFCLLLSIALYQRDIWKISSFTIYGLTLVLLYSASTLYHGHSGALKHLLQKIDYVSIYLLIAGSYMPFALVTLRHDGGWWIFSVIWILAIFGITNELRPRRANRNLSIAIYLGMGWLILFSIGPLIENLSVIGSVWLAVGGLFYTSGLIFYIYDEKVTHFHGVWHLFVLAGSCCHYYSVLRYVALN